MKTTMKATMKTRTKRFVRPQRDKRNVELQELRAEIGARVQSFRKSRGLSQERLAAVLQIHQSAVCRIENGIQSLTAEQLALLASHFQFSPELIIPQATDNTS